MSRYIGEMAAKPATDTSADIDALYQLPPNEFTGARNELATRLKRAGRAEEAERVRGLARPTLSAWVVNQLYWRHRAEFDALIKSGERFRVAQAQQLGGGSADLRGALEARREALAALAKRAAEVLRTSGHDPSSGMMRRITTTLEALATYGNADGGPRAGRLAQDVDPPGFEALATLVPIPSDGRKEKIDPRVLPFRQQAAPKKGKRIDPEEERRAREAQARTALREAERQLRDARKAAEQAEAAMRKVATKVKETERERARLEKQFETAAAAAEAATKEARRIAREAEDAAQAVTDAESALERARAAMKELEG